MKANLSRFAAVLAIAFFSGAAQAASHEDFVAESQAAIINALVAGASAYAPEDLRLARESLELSRQAIARKEFAHALHLASVAAEAARTAEAKSRQQRAFESTASR